MKILNYFAITLLLLITVQCEKESDTCHKGMDFANHYNKTVYVNIYGFYPDTLLSPYYGVGKSSSNKVYAGEANSTALDIRECYEKKLSPSDTLMIYIFDADVLESHSWHDVSVNYMILQRYDLSLKDLKDLNWIISYPPSIEMKNMKMYPPYK